MELVTGRAGSPHITAQQDRQLHQGIWGEEAYILNTGNMLEPEVQSSNKILIKDGALMFQGALFTVKVGTTDEITINNGNQGMQRKDLVVARYKYDSSQNIESAEWVVIQGTPVANNPVAPTGTDGDIQAGDATVDCPFMIVNLDGINVTGVDIIPEKIPTLPELIGNLRVYDTSNNGAWTVVKHPGRWTELHITAMIPRASTEAYELPLNFPDGIRLRNAQTFITPARNGWNVANYYHNNDNQDSQATPINHTNLVFSAKTTQSLTYYFEVLVCGFEV